MSQGDKDETPRPISVELVPHDPAWAALASAEAERLGLAIGPLQSDVHHIGSTAIPGLCAKPILDLLLVVGDLASLDARREDIERLGYIWWGEYGLPGRRYCTRDDAVSGRRLVQLHAFARVSTAAVKRHLAFRDYLRAHPLLAKEYEREKRRCAALHEDDSHAYADCKSEWVARFEAEAIGVHSR